MYKGMLTCIAIMATAGCVKETSDTGDICVVLLLLSIIHYHYRLLSNKKNIYIYISVENMNYCDF